ncbi:MAG: threonylcarbamoyl-AMP synthase [Saprospiraceae bacterium]|nr:threonylcarbamoyl-AMP synthase [Saprospiraceae bacterium]
MTTYNTQIGTDFQVAATYLSSGELVAIPTETVYGLAGNALDPAAVVRIFEVKNRPAFDPLIVHISEIGEVERYASDFPPEARKLAENVWPGPLTLLLPKRPLVPDLVTSGLPRVALRVPAHPLTRALLKKLPYPLAAPSANPFGYVSPTTARHVANQLAGKIPYILDGGPCQVGLESTIVGFENGRLTVYRLGGLSLETLEVLSGVQVHIQLNQSSNPAAPGMLKSHYAPQKKLHLTDLANLKNLLLPGQKTAVITFIHRTDLPQEVFQMPLSENGDMAEAAQNLFSVLRTLDAGDADVLFAELAPDHGLGRAINDRLRRAASRE